ncbi:MAG: SRPBCC family protein [Verrucomicrobiota bacterium]|nr:SRPBCC family protein [Verrucomicrobiota bacterium]
MNRNSGNQQSGMDGREMFAKGLGVFSIGLGLAEIFASRELARLIGVKNRPTIFAALGAREILSGVGILVQRRPAGWLWSRVIGDIMDLSLLGVAMADRSNERERVEAAAGAVGGVMIADIISAVQNSRDTRPIRVEKVVAIDRPANELYDYWREFENLPKFMRHLESVRKTGQNRSHWRAKGPAGTSVEWEAEIVDDRPNELISWRSLPGADVSNSGSVRFERAPGGRGTFVRVKMQYDPPGGFFGASIAKLLGEEPSVQVQRDLYRFKQVMETGQVVTTEGQPAGRPSSTGFYDTDNTKR